jgi:spore coat polysaccharide biosynthesis protein SpsF
MQAARIVGVVQARLSSRRLPGKILMELRGRPSLDYLLESLAQVRGLDARVLATSTDASDDATAEYARRRDLPCHRGSLDHVAERLLRAAEEQGGDAFVRVNGDSPLLDPLLVEHAIGLYRQHAPDLVTNVFPRSFPKGQSVEILSVEAMRRALGQMRAPEEREHVTPFIYAHAGEFSIRSFQSDTPRPEVQLSVDSREDFDRCESIIGQLGVPPWRAGWRGCVAAYDRIVAQRRPVAAS